MFTVEVTDMPGRTVDSQEKRVYLTLQNHLNPCHVIIDAYGNITGRAVPYLGFGFDKIRGNVDEYGCEKPLGYVTLRYAAAITAIYRMILGYDLRRGWKNALRMRRVY